MPPCSFAFETGYAGALHPLQLLIEETRPRPEITLSAPPDLLDDSSAYRHFMEILELPLPGTPYYPRGDTRVYVDVGSGRSCVISPDGTILFTASVPPPVQQTSPGLAGDVFRAWEAVSPLEPVMGGAKFEVGRVTRDGDVTAVEFTLTAGAVPVQWASAAAEVTHGMVSKLTLKLSVVSFTGEEFLPLPLKQASALVPAGGAARLDLRYIAGDGGTARIYWAVRE
jgi:hypothetical protein